MRVASNFPTAYVRVASQTYVLQHIFKMIHQLKKIDGAKTCFRSEQQIVDNQNKAKQTLKLR